MALKINRNLQKVMKVTGWVLLIVIIASMLKILIWERNYYGVKSGQTRSETMPVLTDIDKPTAIEETEITEEDIAEFKTISNIPKIIEIPRLGLKTRVQTSAPGGTTLPLPRNIHDTMWFSASSRPGQDGITIISGIHSSPSKDGAFKNLDSLEKGDKITLTDGEDKQYEYEVAEMKIVNEADIKKELPNAQQKVDNKETLSLIMAKKSSSADAYKSIVMLRATRK